jgi:S-DNA-T family DNA segregation ATPase FtsK/SpoIIIE
VTTHNGHHGQPGRIIHLFGEDARAGPDHADSEDPLDDRTVLSPDELPDDDGVTSDAGPQEPAGEPAAESERRLPAVPAGRAAATLEGRVVQPWQRQPELRPVLPAWVIDAAERRAAGTWVVLHIRHSMTYHLVRAPFYAVKIAWYAPTGAYRAVRWLVRWVFDAEAAPLRRHAVEKTDSETYLRLVFLRNDRVKLRLIVTGCGTVATGGAVGAVAVTAGQVGLYALAGAAVFAAGIAGRRQSGRRLIEPAVVIPRARKLTPDMVIRAFLAAKLCTDDDLITFVRGPWREADGWLVVVEVPYGRTAKEVIKAKDKLAAALRVDEVQLFLDRVRHGGGHAGMVELWLADEDPYAKPPPVTPLLEAEEVDFWQPIPYGIDARRRPVELSLLWSSLLVGSIPRMGKTFAARLPAAAGALDPFLRLVVFDGKGGRDWKPFQAVAYRYGSGIRKVVVEHLAQVLADAVEDMNVRYETLQTLPDEVCPEGKLTPALSRNRRMNMPLTLICIDEVHRYLENDAFGGVIGDALTELVKVGPAVGIIPVLATQKPDSRAIPAKLRDAMGTRFALKTMTWQASETILGTGTSKAGINAANFLRSHKGVGFLLGADDTEQGDKDVQVVRTHLADGLVIAKICERARQIRADAGTLEGAAAGEDLITEKPVAHLLDDVLAAFAAGEKQLHSIAICGRLAETNPATYDGWDQTLFAAAVKPYGVETKQIWMKVPEGENPNRMGVTRQQILDALAARL